MHQSDTDIFYSSDEEEPTSPLANAVMEELEKKGQTVPKGAGEPASFDAEESLRRLQEELSGLATVPTTAKEVVEYDDGLQKVAIEEALKLDEMEVFLQTVKERGLEKQPALQGQVRAAEEYLAAIKEQPALLRYMSQVKHFLALKEAHGFRELGEALDELVAKELAFRAIRDPEKDSTKTIVIRANGRELAYLPRRGSIISEECWHHATSARDAVQVAGAKRRQEIGQELEVFKAKADPDFNPYKGLREEAEGVFFLSTSFPETRKDVQAGKFVYEPTGRIRFARMLIPIGRGNFTVQEVFEPDHIEFVLHQARDPQGRRRWFPLSPEKFDPEKAPRAIAEIVWPALKFWYLSLAWQAESEINPVQLQGNEPGVCGIYIPGAMTLNRGPDDLALKIRGIGGGKLILEDYLSRNRVFDFEALKGQEFSIEEPEFQEVPSEWRLAFIQASIVRGFIGLVAGWQRNSEIMARRQKLEPLITVTEGLAERKTGYSVFHIPRATTSTRGPCHITCQVEWQEKGIVLQDYASWVDPRDGGSRGPIVLDEIVGKPIPWQPAKGEKPVVEVFRHLLADRESYETWKASQGEAAEEDNGASSGNA